MRPENERPTVSIWCLVYNHEPYLRQCLEGFVMQKTNFRVEAIVHDDVSTDNSAAIIREYAEKYPDLIKPIFETENQHSKHDGTLDRIMINACDGKYVAKCEGDDYWTDPLKLQKQVDFLESHPDYSMCYHNAWQDRDDRRGIFVNDSISEHDVTLEEMLAAWRIPTASILYRRDLEQRVSKLSPHPNGDYCLELRLLSAGKIHYDPSVMSVYRMHGDSVSADMNRNKVKMYQDIINLLQDARVLYESDSDQVLFNQAIQKYELLIWDYQISNHPIKKWFYRKTYTRAIKRWLGKWV